MKVNGTCINTKIYYFALAVKEYTASVKCYKKDI